MQVWFTKISLALEADQMEEDPSEVTNDWMEFVLSGKPDLFTTKELAISSIIPQVIRELSDLMEVPPEPDDLFRLHAGCHEERFRIRDFNMDLIAEAVVGSVEVKHE